MMAVILGCSRSRLRALSSLLSVFVLMAHEMIAIEPGEQPTRMLTWKPGFPQQFMRRSHEDCFPLPLLET